MNEPSPEDYLEAERRFQITLLVAVAACMVMFAWGFQLGEKYENDRHRGGQHDTKLPAGGVWPYDAPKSHCKSRCDV